MIHSLELLGENGPRKERAFAKRKRHTVRLPRPPKTFRRSLRDKPNPSLRGRRDGRSQAKIQTVSRTASTRITGTQPQCHFGSSPSSSGSQTASSEAISLRSKDRASFFRESCSSSGIEK